MNFKEYIQQNRVRMNMTQTELGSLLGVSNTTISNYEKGVSYPSFKVLIKLFRIFNTPLNSIGVLQSNILDALCENVGDMSAVRIIEADSSLSCADIKERDFFFIKRFDKVIENGVLAYYEYENKRVIYKLYRHNDGYILRPHSAGAGTPVRVEKIPKNLYEIVSIFKFLS